MTGAPAAVSKDTSAAYRWGLMAFLTVALTLYGLTILVVSVLLPQMQGAFSATQDQIAWVVTFNLLATAVVTPMTGWLVNRFGQRSVMLVGVAGFTLATVGCGISENLVPLVLFRVVQGAFGAPLVPLGQAITLDIFPKHQHGMATSIFGMAVVIGPALGPLLGGYLAEQYDWRWAFFMIVPFGVVAFLGLMALLPEKGRGGNVRLDWTGFLSLSAAVVGLQLMLDRGQRLDWFESAEIVIWATLAVVALHVFIVHSASARQPFLNPRLLRDRNYALGQLIVFIYGMMNFTPMVLLPPMLKTLYGVPDDVIGYIVAARGLGALIGFFSSMYISKLDPRVGMSAGFALQAVAGYMMAGFEFNVTPSMVAVVSVMQGICVGVIWVPLTVATFATLPAQFIPEGSAVFHLLRNLGSSIFIALSVNLVIVSGKQSYAYLSEFVTPLNPTLSLPWAMGGYDIGDPAALGRLAAEVGRQAALIGYIDAFMLYTMSSVLAIPLVLLLKVRRAGHA